MHSRNTMAAMIVKMNLMLWLVMTPLTYDLKRETLSRAL